MDLGPGTAVVVVYVFRLGTPDRMSGHRPPALGTAGNATREHPRSVVVLGELHIVLNSFSRHVNPLARDARVRYGDGYPFLFRPPGYLHTLLVAFAVGTVHRLLISLGPAPVEPPDPVALLRVEP